MSNMDYIDIQVSASASNANAQLDTLIAKLNIVHSSLSKVGGRSINFGSAVKTQSNIARTGLNNLSASMNKTTKSTKSLASTFGTLYINLFRIIRVFKALGKVLSGTMDYMESFNFWDVAISSATGRTGEWQELGFDDAKSYADAFKQELADFNQKMTGFKTDVATGDISVSNMPNLGINLTDLTTFQAEIVSLTSSLGLCTSVSYDAAKALSAITADMSSLKNIDIKTVMTNFQSGLIGQSRALYKYSIDITNATLQTYAYKYGIDKSVSAMTQAEKMQLRLLAILDQSKISWGDLANTIEQPANQFRVLKNGIKNLGITIGKILMPMVSTTLPYLNAMIRALQVFAEWVAKIAGVDLKVENASTGTTDIFDGIEEGADDATESIKALKKSMTTLGIDELNINDPNSGNGDAGSDSNNGGVDLSDEISNSLAEHKKAWDDAYGNMQDKSTQMADAIVEAFKSKDYESIGTYISTGITNALNSIQWDDVYAVAGNFGAGLAQFLNGSITPEEFSAIGATLAGVLNTAIQTGLAFTYEFDFSNLGESLGTGLNTALSDIDWESISTFAGNLGTGIADSLNSFFETADVEGLAGAVSQFVSSVFTLYIDTVDTTEWGNIGEFITTAICTFFEDMDWSLVGDGISSSVTSLYDFAIGLFDGVDWSSLPQNIIDAIDEFFDGIDWEESFGSVGELIGTAIASGIDLIKGIGDVLGDVATVVKDYFVEKFEEAGFDEDNGFLENGKAIVTGLLNGILEGIASIGTWIYDNVFSPFINGFKEAFDIHSPSKVMAEQGAFIIEGLLEGLAANIGDVIQWFLDLPAKVKEAVGDLAITISTKVEEIGTKLREKWDAAKEFWNEKTDLKEVAAKIASYKAKLKERWSDAREYWKNKIDLKEIAAKIASYKAKLKERWSDAREYWKNKTDLKEVAVKIASIKATAKEQWDNTREYWKKKTDLSQVSVKFNDFLKAIKDKWKEVTDWWEEAKNKFAELILKIKIPKLYVTYDTKDMFANVFKTVFGLEGTPKIGITWQSFATGGFPEDGLFFANHNELVGKFTNGKNVVANNMQIVDGIKYGVREAVSEVLAPYLADIAESNREVANKDFATYIGDREIARANNRGQRSLGMKLITEF